MAGEITTVGFIGLGNMGSKQARELAKLPVSLIVFDKAPEAMKPFQGKAHLARSIAEVGSASDLVGICVQNDSQVNECIEELLPAMKGGSVILIHATVSPTTVAAIAECASARGIEVMDAPVTRTEMTEDGPFVFCPVGGEQALLQRVQPILDAFATDTLLVGPVGSAMALKICSNLLSWCEIVAGLEAFALAEAAGVPAEKLIAVMSRNGIMTPPIRIFAGFRSRPGDQRWREALAVQARIGEKDLKLAEDLAHRVNARAPIASFASRLVKDAVLELCHRSPDRPPVSERER